MYYGAWKKAHTMDESQVLGEHNCNRGRFPASSAPHLLCIEQLSAGDHNGFRLKVQEVFSRHATFGAPLLRIFSDRETARIC